MFRDEGRQNRIVGPNGEEMFHGTTPEGWPNLEVDGNKVFWKWTTDASVEDWGFEATLAAEAYGLGDTTQACIQILEDNGGEPLLGTFWHSSVCMYSVD